MDGARLFRKSSPGHFFLLRAMTSNFAATHHAAAFLGGGGGIDRMPEVPPLPPRGGYLTRKTTIQIDVESGRPVRKLPPLPPTKS